MTAFAIRGVNEGFYGPPWTHDQRLRMVGLLGAWSMTDFLVAPKDDPWHRLHWREPFTEDQLARLGELVEAGNAKGVRIGVALGPGLTIRYSDPHECSALVARVGQLRSVGVGLVALLLDDIPPMLQHEADRFAYADVVDAHLDLVSRFRAGVRELDSLLPIAVCPLVYRGTGDEEYIVRFGHGLADDVALMWTGRQICSETLTTADARAFAESTTHRPLYWDNYPVNDVAMTYELHIGPLRGRSSDLGAHCEGLLANPMPAFAASLLPLHTIAAYLRDPVNYDADAAWLAAVEEFVDDPDDRVAFINFGRCVQDSCLNADAMPDIEPILMEAAFLWRTERLGQAVTALDELARVIASASARLTDPEFCNRSLQAGVAPWVAKYAKGGRALATMAGVIAGADSRPRVEGQPDAGPAGIERLRAALAALQDDRHRVFGDGLEMTLAELIEEYEWVSGR